MVNGRGTRWSCEVGGPPTEDYGSIPNSKNGEAVGKRHTGGYKVARALAELSPQGRYASNMAATLVCAASGIPPIRYCVLTADTGTG
jgi:hypothetical protein